MADGGDGPTPSPTRAVIAAAVAEVVGTFILTFAGTATVLVTGTSRLQSDSRSPSWTTS